MTAGFFYGFLFGFATVLFVALGAFVAVIGRGRKGPDLEPWAAQEPLLKAEITRMRRETSGKVSGITGPVLPVGENG